MSNLSQYIEQVGIPKSYELIVFSGNDVFFVTISRLFQSLESLPKYQVQIINDKLSSLKGCKSKILTYLNDLAAVLTTVKL